MVSAGQQWPTHLFPLTLSGMLAQLHADTEGNRILRRRYAQTRGGTVGQRAVPSMAEGTAGVESAGGAEKATTARPKAWLTEAYGKVWNRRERMDPTTRGCKGGRYCERARKCQWAGKILAERGAP